MQQSVEPMHINEADRIDAPGSFRFLALLLTDLFRPLISEEEIEKRKCYLFETVVCDEVRAT